MKNTYRACAEINLDALKHNIQEIQAVLGDTKLMCVIKNKRLRPWLYCPCP